MEEGPAPNSPLKFTELFHPLLLFTALETVTEGFLWPLSLAKGVRDGVLLDGLVLPFRRQAHVLKCSTQLLTLIAFLYKQTEHRFF